jgi:hypothetical protein
LQSIHFESWFETAALQMLTSITEGNVPAPQLLVDIPDIKVNFDSIADRPKSLAPAFERSIIAYGIQDLLKNEINQRLISLMTQRSSTFDGKWSNFPDTPKGGSICFSGIRVFFSR